jgi:tRNA A-37 threonylcarbamoyl transferase component Bud32
MRLVRGVLAAADTWIVSPDAPQQLPNYALAESLYQGAHTRIWQHPDRTDLVSKLGLLKSVPRDVFRRYWASQGRRECRATHIMQQLGFRTPELLGYGVPLAPWRRYESLIFMRALPAHETLRVFLRRCTDPIVRRAILDEVAAGVAAIYAAGYHHKDCHLENVLRASAGRLIWIDSDLRYTHSATIQRERLRSSLAQLVDTATDFVSGAEWLRFADIVEEQLCKTDWGRTSGGPPIETFRARMQASR